MTNNDSEDLRSEKGGEYWDPLTDTYKNKKTNKGDSDDEDFRECPIKSEKGIETETFVGYEAS